MDDIIIAAASEAFETDLRAGQFGSRSGRMDLASQLALLAVEKLNIDFETMDRSKIAICLEAQTGSMATDALFWNGRDDIGGPSPALFAYTLPSSAIGEIAIRHRLTGPNLCFVGSGRLLEEAGDLLNRGEAKACLCISSRVVTDALSKLIGVPPEANAAALFLRRGGPGMRILGQNDRDIASVCAILCARNSSV